MDIIPAKEALVVGAKTLDPRLPTPTLPPDLQRLVDSVARDAVKSEIAQIPAGVRLALAATEEPPQPSPMPPTDKEVVAMATRVIKVLASARGGPVGVGLVFGALAAVALRGAGVATQSPELRAAGESAGELVSAAGALVSGDYSGGLIAGMSAIPAVVGLSDADAEKSVRAGLAFLKVDPVALISHSEHLATLASEAAQDIRLSGRAAP